MPDLTSEEWVARRTELLTSWTVLTQGLKHCTLEQVEDLLALEATGRKRMSVLRRLIERRSRLRSRKEREDLGVTSRSKSE